MKELLESFKVAKANLTEQWEGMGITTPPTDKEVWGQMRAVSLDNLDGAKEDGLSSYVAKYQDRVNKIDEVLKKL